MVKLKLIATRDITLGDIAAAAKAIQRPLLHYDGRINLADPGGPLRDVSFKGVTRGKGRDFALADPATFEEAPSAVVFSVADCKNLAERWIDVDFRFRSTPFDDFAALELKTVFDAVVLAFGARPVVIFNQKVLGGPKTATDADINDFYGFDVKAAAEEWSLPDPDWPDVHNERLFECWRCGAVRAAYSFSLEDDAVNDVLGSIVLDNTNTACDMCVRDMSIRPPMHPRKRKADVLKGLTMGSSFERGGRQNRPHQGMVWIFEVQVMVEGHPIKCSTFRHVGYMDRGWPTKLAAADAYKAEFPHMRAIRKELAWTSDCDPCTRLRFIIRKDAYVEGHIKCTWA